MAVQSSVNQVDLITFEVLRHRLWEINDEMGLIAARISASPTVYESGDFNTAILTRDGRGLFVGVYVIRQASALDLVVQAVIERFGWAGIHEGDVFMTNDPWAGALHQMDHAVVAPIFWDREIVAWTGIVMHEIDMGGPQPGSWTVGASDVYQECPLMPPIRVVERGELKADVEEAYLRNTRTPYLNALNLRAKIASQVTTRERLQDVIRTYGKQTFLALQEQILDHVRATVRQRLRELPDGTWYETGFLDHDGHTNAIYRLKLAMTKRGDRLSFDFRGTDPQAPGPINCAWSGTVGGILQILFPLLCYDTPWSHGAVMDCIEIISEPGTLNNATFPAAVSMATVQACQLTGNLVVQTVSKMYGCSDASKGELIATGYPGINAAVLSGRNRDGSPFAALMTDPVGGGGARSFRDGIDTAGTLISPSYGIPNAERIESLYPLLVVYRKERADTSGPGTFRGGAGIEFLIAPHGAPAPLTAVLFSNGCSEPEAKGLFGGLPGSVERQLMLRGANLRQLFAAGRVPTDLAHLTYRELDVCAAKAVTTIGLDDLYLNFCSGGGGYGDPLDRDPSAVLADLRRGLCSRELAEGRYGVVLAGEQVDPPATVERRAAIRHDRLARGKGPALDGSLARDGERVGPVGAGLEVVKTASGPWFRCTRCRAGLGPADADPRALGLVLDEPIDGLSPLNRYGLPDEFAVRQFCCPGCGACYSADVVRRGDQELAPEMRLEFAGG